MTFEPKKFNEIFADMRGRTSVITDFEVGSVARTIYESFAYEIALLYEKMRLVYLSAFVDTAEGQQLDMVVSILGITRGLPDYAEGMVAFERDVGNEDIKIPIGTLVATEDTPELPKKVYQTFEPKILLKDHTSVEVKIQAVNRGEDQATPAETIVVMPRPIPGIKSVINRDEIRFQGKTRETDDALRERAKNALISAGKATIVSIENTLLSLPGLKDVKVKENFHYAQGKVEFKRDSETGDITIPKATQLTATIKEGDLEKQIPFETTEQSILKTGESSIKAPVRSLVEGKAGEVTAKEGITWKIEGNDKLATLTVSNPEPILLESFGIAEVYVDGIDFNDASEVQRIREEIDRVRAAGIFVLLKPAIRINVDGVFKIEINPDLKLSKEERAEYENTVRTEIIDFLSGLKMGQSFLFSKLIKNILSIDGIDNLEDFKITTSKGQNSSPIPYSFEDKRIDIEEFEKYDPRYICVASEMKFLWVHMQFKASGLDNDKLDEIKTALESYFEALKASEEAPRKSRIRDVINSVSGITIIPETLKLMPESWCSRLLLKEEAGDEIVDVSFVEQAELGDVFAYHSFLEITGALKLTLPTTATADDKKSVREEIMRKIELYLDELKSEADVVFNDLIELALEVDPVLAVDLDIDDFKISVNGAPLLDRITQDKIEIREFEKARLEYFCITGDIETVKIEVIALQLEYLVPDPPPSEEEQQANINAIKLAVKNAINDFLSDAAPGEDVAYDSLKSAIENLVPEADYNVLQLSLKATSLRDGRGQEANISAPRDIHVRSVELPVMQKISENDISVIVSSSEGEKALLINEMHFMMDRLEHGEN
jgi:uncharacterized phage protein gp47/JayE